MDNIRIMANVRLSAEDLSHIKNLFHKYFLKEDQLWIFGSRADLNKKGGDIDLYIETNIEESKTIAKNKLRYIGDIQDAIGEQKIDLVINALKFDYYPPIYKVAKQEGVRLI